MNWSNLPSLNSLRAFTVVAETGSYSRAARLLNVTHAAVNQQVKLLESHLGVRLVMRKGRGVALTAMGISLARDLANGFEAIRKGVDALTGASAPRPVQITMSPAFAVEWLMPRIAEFQQRHPDIVLMLNPTADVVELRSGGIDLAIRYTDRRRLQLSAVPILISDTVVIGTPELTDGIRSDDVRQLISMPWLEELGTNEVTDWFGRCGVEPDRPLTVSQMPGNLIMQAVRRGDGITYTIRAFFEGEIRAGTMRVLHSDQQFGTFHLVAAPGAVRPAVQTVMDWLVERAETVTG